jgi:thiamine-phosphate pyrophosphorylase
VSDRWRLCHGSGDPKLARRCLLDQARYAIDARIDVLQIRERDLEASDLAAIVSDIVGMARGTATRVLVNDRVDVALACGAAGVHLRSDSVAAAAARLIAPAGFVIGRSVHTVAEALAAGAGVDYLLAGTVWPTSAKPPGRPVLGVDGLAAIVRAAKVPVLAIGGVTLDRIGAVAAHGGAGIAGIGLFIGPAPVSSHAPCRAVPLDDVAGAARARFDTSAAT